MKLIEFAPITADEPTYPRFGIDLGDRIIEIGESDKGSLSDFIWRGTPHLDDLRTYITALAAGESARLRGHSRRQLPHQDIRLHAPLTPRSLRDFYAFEQHVKTANQNRGREVPPEWYQFPVFYFSNTGSIIGHDDPLNLPSYTQALDYELEIAAVIGREGKNIAPADAEAYILGYTILNDWSARDVQRSEMKVGLGPAKGKDFASSLGPCIITPDELADRATGRPGVYDLAMTAFVNGVERSRGNWRDLHWSFGDLIARASQDVALYPGDVIGSGTVGTGCLLETTRGQGPWLQVGDVVELVVERLGTLRNTVSAPSL